MDFKGLFETKTMRALWQLLLQIDHDCFCFPRRSADGDIHRLPFPVEFGFERGEWKWQGRVLRRGDVGHAAAKAQPAVHHQSERFARIEWTEIKNHAVRFGQAAKLRNPQLGRREAL